MLRTRLISGIILIALIILALVLGGPVLTAFLLFVSLVGMREYYNAMRITGDPFTIPEVISYVSVIAYYLFLYFDIDSLVMPMLALTVVIMLMVYVFRYPRYSSGRMAAYVFGMIYVAFLISFIFLIRDMELGKYKVWLVFLSSWGSDTLAYCVGSLIGRHKMTPRLSPKKSIEGAIGGVAGAALLAFIFATVFKQSALLYVIIAAIAAVVSIFGDLAASAIKRQAKIKDYGSLIPGHGGILDRFDSVLFTAPVVYILCLFLMG